jgi:uncharacterized protein YyaL (SSP411 family)
MKKTLILLLIFISVYAKEQQANALINEESPYLRQHQFNPVSWYPWNKASLQLAKDENKLIFVSIGYSTCHWCHVMEKESFENPLIAKLLNKDYVSIKIDKEEMPHLDTTFQNMLSKLTSRRNGWPLNAILTPEQKLVYITTYIPPSFKYNTQGMDTLLPNIAKAYKQKDNKLIKKIIAYENILKKRSKEEHQERSIGLIQTAFTNAIEKRYDILYKGFDKQPKFPLAAHLRLLHTLHALEKNPQTQKMFFDTLTAMAYGGIFDQIEGGFYRYSVYADWVIPHFEKMLYTQAELIPLYLDAYIQTNRNDFKQIIEKTILHTNKVFKNNEELFYSASDADTLNFNQKKEEGFYFTYDYERVKNAFLNNGIRNYQQLMEYFGIDEFGNFQNQRSNVYIFDYKAKKPKHYSRALQILKRLRIQKKPPFVDKKVITSWNAMYITALFKASYINKTYLKQAQQSLEALLKHLYVNNKLYHQKFAYQKASREALLEDYAYVIQTLITAYETTYDKEYLRLAQKLHHFTVSQFYANKQWYLDPNKQYEAQFQDKYYTSPLSVVFHNGLSLANIQSNLEDLEKMKNLILEQKNKIFYRFEEHPEALRALLRIEKGDIILKSNIPKLKTSKHLIKRIKYPFILTSEENSNMILACDEKSCFAYSKNIKDILRAIDK